MGWFFSNFHIKKTAELDADTFQSVLTEVLNTQGYRLADHSDEADLSVSIYDADGAWLSVCSDGLDFYTEESVQRICNPLSDRLSTDVVTVSCFDSDCLLLNRINRKPDVVAWAKIGSYPGLKVRSTPARWSGLVSDTAQWKATLSQKYVFAEDALDSLEPLLGLKHGQGRFCDERIPEDFIKGVRTVYYALPESASKSEPPRLALGVNGLMPCRIGESSIISAINKGGKSRGLAVAFSGSYVEKEDIRFREVQLEYEFDRYPRPTIPLQMEKRQTQTGQWIYWAEIPQFLLREAVKEGLPPRKTREEEFKRGFLVRFTPEGNPRKLLDITVHFIPLKNPEGQCGWCVWMYSGSKRAYIEDYNLGRKDDIYLLDPDDYDLDE